MVGLHSSSVLEPEPRGTVAGSQNFLDGCFQQNISTVTLDMIPGLGRVQIAKSPVAAVDWDDDGKLEIMYVTTNGYLKYVDNIDGSPTVKDTGIDEPRKQTGVA